VGDRFTDYRLTPAKYTQIRRIGCGGSKRVGSNAPSAVGNGLGRQWNGYGPDPQTGFPDGVLNNDA